MFGRSLCAILLATVVTACASRVSNGLASTLPGGETAFLSPTNLDARQTNSAKPVLYVESYAPNSTLFAYHPTARFPRPIEKFGVAQPEGGVGVAPLAVDPSGNLYVCSGESVLGYAPGQTSPFFTLTTIQYGFPSGISFDTSGNLYVSVVRFDAKERGALLEYHPGETKPFEKVRLKTPSSDTLDAAGDVFLSDSRGKGAGVVEIPAGPLKPLQLKLKGVTMPVGIAVSPAGDLYVSDFQLRQVLAYHPNDDNPFQTIGAGSSPGQIMFDPSGDLYVADGGLDQVAVYKPNSTRPFKRIRIGLNGYGALGLAIYPSYPCCGS